MRIESPIVRTRNATWTGILLIVLLALLVRLIVVWQTREVPFVLHPVGDARGYLEWGWRIANGEWLGTRAFYQTPLYAYLLGLLFKVSGCGVGGIRIVQAVCGAATCGLVAVGTASLWGRRTGLTAGILAALYAPAIYYDGLIQKASLDGLLTAGLFALCAATSARPTALRLASVGLLAGLASLNRENALLWIPILLTWAWHAVGAGPPARESAHEGINKFQRPAGRTTTQRRGCVALLLGVACVLGPVLIRNGLVGGAWTVTTYQAGSNFYIGNSRHADGRYRPLVRGHETPEFEWADATRLAETAEGRRLTPREVSRFWFARAWDDIRDDPGRWARLMLAKLGIVFHAYEVPDVEGMNVYTEASTLLRWMSKVWHFGFLLPIAVFGILRLDAWSRTGLSARARRESARPVAPDTQPGVWEQLERARSVTRVTIAAMAVAMSLSVAAFFVLGRYRHSAAILLMPFAAAGLLALADSLGSLGRRRTGRSFAREARVVSDEAHASNPTRDESTPARVPAGPSRTSAAKMSETPSSLRTALALSVALLTIALANRPVADQRELDAYVLMNAGAALAQAGAMERAIAYFERTVDALPASAEANNNLAQALALRGDFLRAIGYYERALQLAPDLPLAEYNLGVALEQTGRLRDAAEHYERAARAEPHNTDAVQAAQRLRRSLGER